MAAKDNNDYIGSVFGRLTVVKDLGRTKNTTHTRRLLRCRCECGNITDVVLKNLKNKNTKSCGCYYKEVHSTHKMGDNPLYMVHYSMVDRCYNKDHKAFKNYGGRGITVCKRWLETKSYKGLFRFIKWAELNGYEKGLEIDRIDNDGRYSPENCRWVTRKENTNNRRCSLKFEYKGIKYCASDLIALHGRKGLTPTNFLKRINRGWSIEKALKEDNKINQYD